MDIHILISNWLRHWHANDDYLHLNKVMLRINVSQIRILRLIFGNIGVHVNIVAVYAIIQNVLLRCLSVIWEHKSSNGSGVVTLLSECLNRFMLQLLFCSELINLPKISPPFNNEHPLCYYYLRHRRKRTKSVFSFVIVDIFYISRNQWSVY